jgi:hypothetical protein
VLIGWVAAHIALVESAPARAGAEHEEVLESCKP